MSIRPLALCLLLLVLPLTPPRLAADELPSWTSSGPEGGNVQALAVSPGLPGSILAGFQNGLFKSADRGRSWGAATDDFGRRVFSLAISADGKAFYAATDRGLFKSTDGGARWPALDDGGDLPTSYRLVAAHPRKAAVVFAVTDRGWLWRSTDGGATRHVVTGPSNVMDLAFALAPRRTVVYAAAGNGLWRSDNDGRTWTDRSPRLAFTPHVDTVAVDPRDPRVLYIGLLHDRRVLLKSLDGGATWTLSQRGLPVVEGQFPPVTELAVDPKSSAVVHAVAGGELFRSTNGGRSWSRSPALPGGTVNVLETAGYGVLAGTRAGVLLSTDQGLTWRLRVAGLTATAIEATAIGRQAPARLYATVRLTGIFGTSDQGRSWLRLMDAVRPAPLAVDPNDSNVLYTAADPGLVKSVDGGQTWVEVQRFQCLAISQIVLDFRQPAGFFLSGGLRADRFGCLEPYLCTYFRSLDAGENWRCLGAAADIFPGSGGAFLGAEPFTSAIFLRPTFGDLFRSTNGGDDWTYLGEMYASSFAASPHVEGTLWIGEGGAVLRSRDGGQTWQSFSTGLPGQTVVGLAPDPSDAATLYAATRDSGVFKSVDAGETWSLAGIWPRGVPFQGRLLVDPGDPAVVYAGTAGLGVLRLDQNEDP